MPHPYSACFEEKAGVLVDIENLDKEAENSLVLKTSQEMRMLSRSLSDCKSLLLNVMIQVSQFVSNS